MIIDCISDTHGKHEQLNLFGGDVLIVAGDISSNNKPINYEQFNSWLSKQEYDVKIVVGGNHDTFLEKDYVDKENLLDAAIYLCNSDCTIDGVRFWGSPCTPKFRGVNADCTGFMRHPDSIESVWGDIPEGLDVLITHGPPHGILDKNIYGNMCGCNSLYKKMQSLLKKPLYHVFGHIHEDYGSISIDSTNYINCSFVDENYSPKNKSYRFVI